MAFSPYSSVINNQPKFQPPIPVELLMRGNQQQHAEAMQSAQQLGSQLDSLHQMSTLPGADTEAKNKKIAELEQSVQDLSTNDLSQPNIQAQIHANISKITSDPEFMSAVSRGQQAKSIYAQKQEFDSKGIQLQPWQQQPLNEINEYINSGKFDPNKRFSGQLYAPPKTEDNFMKGAKDLHESGEIGYKNGRWFSTTGVASDRLDGVYDQTIKNTPNAELDYRNHAMYDHPNYLNEFKQELTQKAQEKYNLAQQAVRVGDGTTHDRYMQEYQQDLQMANNASSNIALDYYTNQYKNNDKQQLVNSFKWTKEAEPKADEFAIKSAELQNQEHLKLFEQGLPGIGVLTPEQQKQYLTGNISGLPIGDVIKEANRVKAEQAIQLYQAKSDVTQARQETLLKDRAALLAKSGNKPSTIIKLNGIEGPISKWDGEINKIDSNTDPDKASLVDILKSNPNEFGITKEDYENIKEDKITFDGTDLVLHTGSGRDNIRIGKDALRNVLYGKKFDGTTAPISNEDPLGIN